MKEHFHRCCWNPTLLDQLYPHLQSFLRLHLHFSALHLRLFLSERRVGWKTDAAEGPSNTLSKNSPPLNRLPASANAFRTMSGASAAIWLAAAFGSPETLHVCHQPLFRACALSMHRDLKGRTRLVSKFHFKKQMHRTGIHWFPADTLGAWFRG